MCLYYIYGATLIETSQLAGMNGTGQMSDVAFMKRFIKCNGWFQWITENIKPNAVTGYQLPEILKPYRIGSFVEKRKKDRLQMVIFSLS